MPRVTRATTRRAVSATITPNAASSEPEQPTLKRKGRQAAIKKEEEETEEPNLLTIGTPGKHKLSEPPSSKRRSSTKRIKTEDDDDGHFTITIKSSSPQTPKLPIKREEEPSSPNTNTTTLRAKKLKSYTQNAHKSPFPTFPSPTPQQCHLAHKILTTLHGPRTRPSQPLLKAPTSRSGCGDSPSVLDALIRTILSQNTSDANSSRAKLSMDSVYGASDDWEGIISGGVSKLEAAIRCGGLSAVKSKVIVDILTQTKEKYGSYSLDHLFDATDEEAMRELLGFQGVGPKTASCVLLFCLKRESFAVDTHVWRITGLLGWRPKTATRDETHAHLDVRIPNEEKYGLHILFVKHGKVCEECKAGGKNLGKCELRKAFQVKG